MQSSELNHMREDNLLREIRNKCEETFLKSLLLAFISSRIKNCT